VITELQTFPELNAISEGMFVIYTNIFDIYLRITLFKVQVQMSNDNTFVNDPSFTSGDSMYVVSTRLRGVGVGFPGILGMSLGTMPVMSCISHVHH